MHRIDGADNVAGMWSDNGPGPGTQITDDFMNDVQENLCQFIEAAGITLVKGTYTQLTAAVAAYIAAHNAVTNPHSATAAATADRLVLRDASGRAAFADPSAAGDAATKGWVEAQAVALTTPGVGAGWALSSVKYWKDRGGVVHMQGKAQHNAGGILFQFPAGLCPADHRGFACAAGAVDAAAFVQVASTGAVTVDGVGSGVFVYFDGISFLAEQ